MSPWDLIGDEEIAGGPSICQEIILGSLGWPYLPLPKSKWQCRAGKHLLGIDVEFLEE